MPWEQLTDAGLWGLFVSAFVSSTLLPGGSEAVLAYLAGGGHYSSTSLLVVATLGNTLGGMTSWGLGRLLAIRFPFKTLEEPKHRRALHQLQRWGSPALLFSWLPIVGDPLCVAAGWLKVHPLLSLSFIGLGKGLRYLLILGAMHQ
jgi:membrane protein YqaA with SNARE-associated domain